MITGEIKNQIDRICPGIFNDTRSVVGVAGSR